MKRRRNNIYYLVLFLIILLIMISRARVPVINFTRALVHPLKAKISSVSFWARGIFSGITEISTIRNENEDLSQKIKSLQIDGNQLNELRHENEVLKKQLGFLEQHQSSNLIPSLIIGREPFASLDRVTIDNGSTDGVVLNAAVESDGFLVGKVTQVSENQATVTLISSKDSIIQAMLQNSRTLGILRGSLSGVRLENIPQDTQISDREAVVTSGLGGEIAPGILIGWARGEVSGKSDIYKILSVDLACDLNKLEFVFVVK